MQPPKNPINEEQLSQLMDGEWHELNPSDCVAGICNDEALKAKWSRYHLIRDVMKNEPVSTDQALANSIFSAIEDEPTYSNITPFTSPVHNTANTASQVDDQEMGVAVDEPVSRAHVEPQRTGRGWLGQGLAGFALAASVAVVTVVGVNVWQGQPSVNPAATSVATADNTGTLDSTVEAVSSPFAGQLEGAPLPVVEFVANTGSYWVSPQTAERVEGEKRLNMFLSQHIENSPTASREGLLPYSRLVGYDEQNQEQ